jgi:hypothetical protein
VGTVRFEDAIVSGLLPLHEWHVKSLTESEAHAWLQQAQQSQRIAHLAGTSAVTERVRELVARFWLGRPIYLQYLSMRAAAQTRYERALAELVYGQLLLTLRLKGAFEHLDRGLHDARDLLATRDYCTLVRRHELLRYLPLGDEPRPPQDLSALLAEATVIKRLVGMRARSSAGNSADTLG